MGIDSSSVCIIGGTGKMGSWLGTLFEADGLQVVSIGKDTVLKARDAVPLCKVVVVSVPISDAVEVISEVAPLVREETLLVDLTSIKSATMRAMLSLSKAQVAGVHPLFGPGETAGPSSRVALCPGRGKEGIQWIERFFKRKGFAVSMIDPETHDRMMGLIQGVNHFSTIVLALCMAESGFSLEDMTELSTAGFMKRIERIHAMLAQPGELFQSLLMENKEAVGFLKNYHDQAGRLIGIVRKGDTAGFERIWKTITRFFGHNGKVLR